jgi:hypothetical protein
MELIQQPEAVAYAKHKNLKLAADELGISWHTLYSRLKRQGVAVTGDKLRYGSDRDRLSALAEAEFLRLIPAAKNMNAVRFQSKFDFMVNGLKIDVKCSMPRRLSKRYEAKSWAFSFKKQTLSCDFICCFCMGDDKQIAKILLVPSEFFKGLSTVSVSVAGGSKWLDYQISPNELSGFFASVNAEQTEQEAA